MLEQESQYSCRSWLTLNPMEVELAPNTGLAARYTLRVPETATEGTYACGIGYLTAPRPVPAGFSGIRTQVRIVATFYVTVGDPPIDGAIKAIRLEKAEPPAGKAAPVGASQWRAVLIIENRGTRVFRSKGKLDVLNANGQVVESYDIPDLPILR